MKLVILLVLAILPMMIIPVFGESEPQRFTMISSIQSDKSDYYIGEDIIINGTLTIFEIINNESIDIGWTFDDLILNSTATITYDLLGALAISGPELLGSGQSTLQPDGNFNFTINWSDRELWGDYSNTVRLAITMQEIDMNYNFYSSNQPDTTNDELYKKIIENDEDISLHDENMILHEAEMAQQNIHITNQNSTINTHRTILDNHDPMILYNEEMGYYNKNMITNLNNTILLQQQHIDSIETQLTLIGGYLVNLNVTLGQDFPAILDAKSINEVLNENKRLQNEIVLFTVSIEDNKIALEQAILDGNEAKITKFTNAIGSDQVSRAIAQAKLNMTYLYLDFYDLLN